MATHEIWVEGFKRSDANVKAGRYASVEADTFQDACKKLIKEDEIFSKHYDKRKHTFMGCRIYASEEKARAYCG